MRTDLCFKCSNEDSMLCKICGIAEDGAREHFKQKPVTHADALRAMTDETLAEALCLIYTGLGPVHSDDGRAWLDWLKQEAQE